MLAPSVVSGIHRTAHLAVTGAARATGCARSRPPGAAGKRGSGGSWLGAHVDADGGPQRHGIEDGVGGGQLAAGAAWQLITT